MRGPEILTWTGTGTKAKTKAGNGTGPGPGNGPSSGATEVSYYRGYRGFVDTETSEAAGTLSFLRQGESSYYRGLALPRFHATEASEAIKVPVYRGSSLPRFRST